MRKKREQIGPDLGVNWYCSVAEHYFRACLPEGTDPTRRGGRVVDRGGLENRFTER